MNFLEDARPRGELEISVLKNGIEIERYRQTNMIMNSARDALARLIGGSGAGKVVTRIGIGTNGDGPHPEDEELTEPYIKNVSGVSYPASGEVAFAFSVGRGEANGKKVREFGLICSDGALFARRTRGVIEKEDDIEINGNWIIKF